MADIRVRRRVIAALVIVLGFAMGVLAFHFGSQSKRPETFGVLIVVASDEASIKDTLLDSLSVTAGSLTRPEGDFTVTGSWDSCVPAGIVGTLAPGRSIDLEVETVVKGNDFASTATLRGLNRDTLEAIIDESEARIDWLADIAGIESSRVPRISIDEAIDQLERLASQGEACVVVATIPYQEAEFVTVTMPEIGTIGSRRTGEGFVDTWLGIKVFGQQPAA